MNIPGRLTSTISLLSVLLVCLACGRDTTSASDGKNTPPIPVGQDSSSEVEEMEIESLEYLLEMSGVGEESSTEDSPRRYEEPWYEEQRRMNVAFQDWVQENLPDALKALEDEPSTAVPFYNDIIRITDESMEHRVVHKTDPEYRETVLRVVGQATREPIGSLSDLDWDGFSWLLHALRALDVSELDEEQLDMLRVHIAGMFSYVHLKWEKQDMFPVWASMLRREFADFVQDQ